MSDITWRQGRVDTSTGSVSYDMTSIATEKTDIPLGSYQFVLPHDSIQFKKVSNGTTTDVNYSNIKRYIFLYDENDVYLGYQQITNELYSFETSKFANARKFIFECYYGTAYNMYPSQPQVVTETTYYYMVMCSFRFNVVQFHEVNNNWISVNATPVEHEAIELPLPLSYWRIDKIHNNGYPWHERLGDIIPILFIWILTNDTLLNIPAAEQRKYWKSLLLWLHEESNDGRTTRVFDYDFKRDGLEAEPQLLLSAIMKNIDLDLLSEDELESFIDNLIKTYKTAKALREDLSKMALWNKSLHYLWQKFYRKYIPETRNIYEGESLSIDENNNLVTIGENTLYGALETEGVSLRLKDILNADAGANFYKTPYDGSVVLHPWVLPWYNIDGDSYSDVRADDKIISALYNDTQLNFTEHQDSNNIYTRLLMPQNDRRVEVEDLNRNFWVIGLVITAIQNEIFGPSSIGEIIKGIIKELADLWENILYLWGGTAIIALTPKYPLHEIIFTPLYESDFRPYLKYDNFDKNVISEDNLKKILSPILKEYLNTNLLITPEVRLNNYEKNYFSEVLFPFFLRYDRNLDDWEDSQVANIIITANDTELLNRTYGVKLFDNKIEYCYPFSNIPNEDISEGRYYNIIRLEFIYSASLSTYSMFSIELYDVGYEIVNTKILDNGIKDIQKRKIATITYTENSDNISFNYEDNTDWLAETGITDVLTGFYLGDLLSGYIDKGGD